MRGQCTGGRGPEGALGGSPPWGAGLIPLAGAAWPIPSSPAYRTSVPPTGLQVHSVPSTALAPAGPNLHQQAFSHFLPCQDGLF